MDNTENFKKKENLNENVPQWVTDSVKAWLVKLKDDTNLIGKINENLDDVAARTFYYKVDWDNVEYQIENVKSYLNAIKDKQRSELKDLSWAWILSVQIALESLWYEVGKIDWWFWWETKNGVLRFQNQNGLNPDGFPGKETIKKLCDALDNPNQFKAQNEKKPAAVKASAWASSGGNGGNSGGEKKPTDWSLDPATENPSWNDEGYQWTITFEEEKQSIVDSIKSKFADVLKDPKWDTVGLTSTGKLILSSIAIPNTNVECDIDLAKCLDKNANVDENRTKKVLEEGIKKVVNMKKTQTWWYLLKQNYCGNKNIPADVLGFNENFLKNLSDVEKWRIKRYFKKFDNYGIELDSHTTYDLDNWKIKLELDNSRGNKDYNVYKNNDDLIIDAAKVVNDDYTLNKNAFFQIMRDIIMKIIKREDFE